MSMYAVYMIEGINRDFSIIVDCLNVFIHDKSSEQPQNDKWPVNDKLRVYLFGKSAEKDFCVK